jgi:hypothetical protein
LAHEHSREIANAFLFVPAVPPPDKFEREVVNYGRQAHSPAEAKFEPSIKSLATVPIVFFVNARRQIIHSNKRESNGTPVFVVFWADGTSLVMAKFIRKAILRRERGREYATPKSHEGNHHKRVCIACSNRGHRARAGIGSCPSRKSNGRGGKRTLAFGTNSMWRCGERD